MCVHCGNHTCTCRVLNKPSTNALVAELTKLEERVKLCQIQLASEQDAYENVSLATEMYIIIHVHKVAKPFVMCCAGSLFYLVKEIKGH